MDTKEEVIEEIEEIEDNPKEEKEPLKNNIEDVIINNTPIVEEEKISQEPTIEKEDIKKEDVKIQETKLEEKPQEVKDENNENKIEKEVEVNLEQPKENKAPLIILLSILLVLDIAALVIYIIGIDKVFSFIK